MDNTSVCILSMNQFSKVKKQSADLEVFETCCENSEQPCITVTST